MRTPLFAGEDRTHFWGEGGWAGMGEVGIGYRKAGRRGGGGGGGGGLRSGQSGHSDLGPSKGFPRGMNVFEPSELVLGYVSVSFVHHSPSC